jgi:hypothetical protein
MHSGAGEQLEAYLTKEPKYFLAIPKSESVTLADYGVIGGISTS